MPRADGAAGLRDPASRSGPRAPDRPRRRAVARGREGLKYGRAGAPLAHFIRTASLFCARPAGSSPPSPSRCVVAPEVILRKLGMLRRLLADLGPFADAPLATVIAEHYKVERILELLVTAAADLLQHLLAERGIVAASYRDAFRQAGAAGLISPELASRLDGQPRCATCWCISTRDRSPGGARQHPRRVAGLRAVGGGPGAAGGINGGLIAAARRAYRAGCTPSRQALTLRSFAPAAGKIAVGVGGDLDELFERALEPGVVGAAQHHFLGEEKGEVADLEGRTGAVLRVRAVDLPAVAQEARRARRRPAPLAGLFRRRR